MPSGAHTQYDIQLHIIWTTKYRKPLLKGGIKEKLKILLMQGCSANRIQIIKGNIQPDHIHLMVSIPPPMSVSKMMQYLKGRTSKKLQEEFPKLRKEYWGQHMWATGYFCRSSGKVTSDMVKEYIENQDEKIKKLFEDGNIL